jgi:hypothetical protein
MEELLITQLYLQLHAKQNKLQTSLQKQKSNK